MTADQRLLDLGIVLPAVSSPAGNYAQATYIGNIMYISGKGAPGIKGKVGSGVTQEQAYDCARGIGIMILAIIRAELGSLTRVKKVVKVMGLVNATPDFENHPAVVNGCSDLLVSVFGDRGKHARTSLGAASLPGQSPVIIEAVIEVEPV